MFDIDAPSIPGESAAGVRIGQSIEDILADAKPKATLQLHGTIKYGFGIVHLWVADGLISQIGLCAGYRGFMQGGIHIGSTIEEVQQAIGPVLEDEDDNPIVPIDLCRG